MNGNTYEVSSIKRVTKGLFTWSEEDPSTRKILEGRSTLSWVYTQEILVCVVHKYKMFDREGIQNGGRQKQTYNLGPSALFTGVNNYLSAELSQ